MSRISSVRRTIFGLYLFESLFNLWPAIFNVTSKYIKSLIFFIILVLTTLDKLRYLRFLSFSHGSVNRTSCHPALRKKNDKHATYPHPSLYRFCERHTGFFRNVLLLYAVVKRERQKIRNFTFYDTAVLHTTFYSVSPSPTPRHQKPMSQSYGRQKTSGKHE